MADPCSKCKCSTALHYQDLASGLGAGNAVWCAVDVTNRAGVGVGKRDQDSFSMAFGASHEHVQRRKSEGLSNFEQDGNGWATIALTPRYPPRHPLLPLQTGVRMQVIRWWDGCRQSESELKEATWSRMVHLVAAIEDSVIAPISQLLGHEAWGGCNHMCPLGAGQATAPWSVQANMMDGTSSSGGRGKITTTSRTLHPHTHTRTTTTTATTDQRGGPPTVPRGPTMEVKVCNGGWAYREGRLRETCQKQMKAATRTWRALGNRLGSREAATRTRGTELAPRGAAGRSTAWLACNDVVAQASFAGPTVPCLRGCTWLPDSPYLPLSSPLPTIPTTPT
ncbi:hypothetical protein COCCADRAFT_28722 [Bipolaris zeicola 26-R-13]|uniref:Uncharacterized protein n=1 Tax=Cochliobolus carbonum (strain 26-R-13) TaxID=930089 RepID=W6YGJ1_COCC2|nr:uncharacterized protein COCCADRAFT_28722 [Bipolaris zeicola 26-R-13]EUC30376.1 hypothetical protein COCCADRAFT_28722 [Bipolaris zeicola 26-R-13]